MRLGIPRERLVFVPFGIDAEFFRPIGGPFEECSVVSVGRDAGRDYGILLNVAARLDHSFVIVASKRNIPPRAVIPRNVSVRYDRPLAEVRDLYRHAWLVVVTSKDTAIPDGSDCSGQTVILDALAAGKAVIATYRPWIVDYFIPGQDLVVVEPNDLEALRSAITMLWNDREKREQLARSGQAKVMAQYTTAAFAKALMNTMDTIV